MLNILFEAKKSGILPTTPNLIYFDVHDDACEVLPKSELLKKIGVKNVLDATSKQFWSFVEFDLGVLEDDWLLTGIELDLIKIVVLIDQEENHNRQNKHNRHTSEDGIEHELYSIDHLRWSLDKYGCLGNVMIKEPYHQNARDIFWYC